MYYYIRRFPDGKFQIYGLGALDFLTHAFATKNFLHLLGFVDGDELEQILHFRRDTLEDYYSQLRQHISAPHKGGQLGLSESKSRVIFFSKKRVLPLGLKAMKRR